MQYVKSAEVLKTSAECKVLTSNMDSASAEFRPQSVQAGSEEYSFVQFSKVYRPDCND